MNPFRWFYRLFTSRPAQFRSAYDLTESVDRLQQVVSQSIFRAPVKQCAYGKVTAQKVRIQRLIPFLNNSFKPFFLGGFEQRADGVWLAGRFTMLPLVKVFIGVWLGFALFIGTGFALTASRGNPLLCLIPVGFVGFMILLVAFGSWLSRNDQAWLSAAIEDALAARPPGDPLSPVLPSGKKGRFGLRIAVGILGFGLLLGGVFFYVDHRIQQGRPYRAAVAFLRENSGVGLEFGEVRAIRYTHNYHAQTNFGDGGRERIQMSFAIEGSKENADVWFAFTWIDLTETLKADHLWVRGDHAHEVPLLP